MAENQNVTFNISTGSLLKILVIFLLIAFAYFIRDILLIIFIAIIFASVIEPLVNYLEDKKVPRGAGVGLIYLVLILFIVLAVRLIIPPIAEQFTSLSQNFPDLWAKIIENFSALREYSQEQGLVDKIQQGLKGMESWFEGAASSVYDFIVTVFRSIINFLVILVITFYLVVEKDAIAKLFRAVAPVKYHSYLINLFVEVQKKIGAWARGQLMLGLIIAGLSFVGLLFIIPKYALVLALIAGMTEFIPYLGPILGAIPAVFLGFTVPPISLWRGVAVLILFIVIQQAEEKYVVPKIMQKQLGLNPVVTIIIMLIGARLAGIIGLILAIPVATAIGVVAKDFIQKSELPKIKDKLDHSQEPAE